jgi:hypothetical protein
MTPQWEGLEALMGGCGSGSWYRGSSKNTVEGCKSLDVNWLNRKGYLASGMWATVRWTRNGEDSGNISLRAEVGRIVLEYRSRSGGGDWESVTEPVRLTWTWCNYGGQRPWFICPGAGCGRRVGKLYAAGRYFLCRHCYDLAYDCQRETAHDRLLRKAQNIRQRLGGSASIAEPFPWKPKGMHWKTYWRIRERSEDAELLSWGALELWLDERYRSLRC